MPDDLCTCGHPKTDHVDSALFSWCRNCMCVDFEPAEPEIRDIPHARSSDPETSHLSAKAIEQREGKTKEFNPNTLKHLALKAYADGPKTPTEAKRWANNSELEKRISDLKNARLIDMTGERRRDPKTKAWGDEYVLNDRGWMVLGVLNQGGKIRV